MSTLAVIVPPDLPTEQLRTVVTSTENAGVQELWLWEDCFAQGGVAMAAAALAWTENLRVGIGLFPVPLRSLALTAMEISALARLFPGRLLPGLGHGIQDWMAQAGVRAASPMTMLREHTVALRALLHGEEVTTSGRYVQLDRVQLRWPPESDHQPPVLIGGRGPRTCALAGELGDGVILDDPALIEETLPVVRSAWAEAERDGQPEVVLFEPVSPDSTAATLHDRVRQRAEQGVTRLAFLAVDSDRRPETGPALTAFLQAAGEAQALITRG